MKKLGAIGVVMLIIVGTLFTLIVPSFFTVRTGEVAAIRTFGVVNEALQPGLYFRFWPISDRIYYDVTIRQIQFTFTAYSIDAQNVQGSVTIQYQLDASDIITVAEQFGTLGMLEQ